MILTVYLLTLTTFSRGAMKILCLSLMFASSVWAQADGAEAVIKKVRDHNQGFVSEVSEMSLFIQDEKGQSVERKLKAKTIEVNSSEVGNKSLIEFVSPADVKGTRLLSWLNRKEEKSQWIYLPALKKKKRILAGNQNSSFMGSEFTFEDVGGREIDLFTYKMLKVEGKSGAQVWTIEQTSKKDSSQKMKLTIDEKMMAIVKAEYLNPRGEVSKVSEMKNFQSFKVKDRTIYRAAEVTMSNKENMKSSSFKWSKRELGTALNENDFNPNLIERP
jgi:hypothetical protein